MEVSSQMGPFSIVPEWVLNRDLTATALKLYIVMARFADWHTGMAFPSRETLAERMACSLKTIDRAVIELVAADCMEKISRGRYNSALYKVFQVDPRGTDLSHERTDLSDEGTDLSSRLDKNDHLTITTEREPNNDIERARQMPDDFIPNESFAERFPDLSIEDEFEAFCDYHLARGSKFKDWDRAFGTWCRNAVRFAKPKTVVHKQELKPAAEGPGKRDWAKQMHDIGEHFECRPGEFGCK